MPFSRLLPLSSVILCFTCSKALERSHVIFMTSQPGNRSVWGARECSINTSMNTNEIISLAVAATLLSSCLAGKCAVWIRTLESWQFFSRMASWFQTEEEKSRLIISTWQLLILLAHADCGKSPACIHLTIVKDQNLWWMCLMSPSIHSSWSDHEAASSDDESKLSRHSGTVVVVQDETALDCRMSCTAVTEDLKPSCTTIEIKTHKTLLELYKTKPCSWKPSFKRWFNKGFKPAP